MRRLSAALTMVLLLALAPALLVLRAAPPAQALENGLARTPPMGWNDWNAFGCNVTEQLVKQTADYLVSSGLKDAGYQYVNIDDCWMTSARNSAGQLVPDPVKFPDGISGTAAYVHSKGLKLGIYESAGTATCQGYPGSLDHEQTDANSFAAWGVDYLKYDNCNHQNVPDQQRYTAMRDALANTGRPIVYSLCNWGLADVWTWGAGAPPTTSTSTSPRWCRSTRPTSSSPRTPSPAPGTTPTCSKSATACRSPRTVPTSVSGRRWPRR
jgi:alpha-galactosidase